MENENNFNGFIDKDAWFYYCRREDGTCCFDGCKCQFYMSDITCDGCPVSIAYGEPY